MARTWLVSVALKSAPKCFLSESSTLLTTSSAATTDENSSIPQHSRTNVMLAARRHPTAHRAAESGATNIAC
jgi:hypothetical protein